MKYLKHIFTSIILAVGVVICAFRWNVWFSNPAEPSWESDTLDIHFNTTIGDVGDTLSILLLGDVHNSLTKEQYLTITDRHPQLDAYAQLGDFMERGYFYYAQQLVHELDGTPLRDLPIINCAGNHEYRKGIARRLPPMWFEMFPQPQNGPINFLGRTYYIDFPYLRYIVIDTNGIHDLRDFTRVVTWLKTILQGADGRFTVVMMHHPVLSSASGRFNLGVFTFFLRTLREADLVFAGHDHNYTRRLPFVNISSVTTRSREPKGLFFGLIPFEKSSEGAFYAILQSTGQTLQLDVYDIEDGTLIDSCSLQHQP